MARKKLEATQVEYKWSDRKRTLFGLPLSFTTYKVSEEKLLINTGFFSTKEEEVRLYRIMDVTLKKTLLQRLFRVGTIHVCSSDKTTPEFDIVSVKQPQEVKELISNLVEEARKKNKVSAREFMVNDSDEEFDFDHE